MTTNSADYARLVEAARELIAAVRDKGHDVAIVRGKLSFQLGPVPEASTVRGKGLGSFALGLDLAPYAEILESPERDRIITEALTEAAP